MALSSAAQRVEAASPGSKCSFGAILRGLPEEDLAFFHQMRDEGRDREYIARVFREDGHQVSSSTVRRHMNGACGCP